MENVIVPQKVIRMLQEGVVVVAYDIFGRFLNVVVTDNIFNVQEYIKRCAHSNISYGKGIVVIDVFKDGQNFSLLMNEADYQSLKQWIEVSNKGSFPTNMELKILYVKVMTGGMSLDMPLTQRFSTAVFDPSYRINEVIQAIKAHTEDSICSKMRRGVEIGRKAYRESGALFSVDESDCCCNNPKFGDM